MSLKRFLAVALAPALAGVAAASITTVPEFTGDLSEGFESFAVGPHFDPFTIFGGAATLDEPANPFVFTSIEDIGPEGRVEAYEGQYMASIVSNSAIIEFDTPITDFGGFFTTVGLPGASEVVFRDDEGAALDTLPMSFTPDVWEWKGWHSDAPFTQIQITTAELAVWELDGLQATVPEPASMSMLVLLGLAAYRRR